MWKKVLVVIAILMLLTGIGFLLFPPVSNCVGQQNADSLIEKYDKVLDNVITEEDAALKEELGVTADSFEEAREKARSTRKAIRSTLSRVSVPTATRSPFRTT